MWWHNIMMVYCQRWGKLQNEGKLNYKSGSQNFHWRVIWSVTKCTIYWCTKSAMATTDYHRQKLCGECNYEIIKFSSSSRLASPFFPLGQICSVRKLWRADSSDMYMACHWNRLISTCLYPSISRCLFCSRSGPVNCTTPLVKLLSCLSIIATLKFEFLKIKS